MKQVLQIIIIILFPFLLPSITEAQTLEEVNTQGLNQNLAAMNISGVWSAASVTTGGVGFFTADDKRWKAYHAVNFVFGALNSLVVIKGRSDLIKGKTSNWSYQEAMTQHKKIERLYVFNNAFNYAFIFGGLFLREKSKSFDNPDKRDIFQGIGEGLITQGIFFLIFDTSMFFVQKNFVDNKLSKVIPDQISFSGRQIGLRWNLNRL